MKYKVRMTVSIGVVINASDEETAMEKAANRVEKLIDGANNMYLAMCIVDTAEPATITLDDKRRKAEDALARLVRGVSRVGE